MTRRRVGLDIETTATTGQAKRNLEELRSDVRAVEGEHEIDLAVDDNASDELADIRGKLDSLTERDRRVSLEFAAAGLERQIRNAEQALGRLDKYDQDAIQVKIEARDNASKRLEAIRTELRQLDGDTARVRVDSGGSLDEIKGQFEDLVGPGAGAAALGRGGLIGGAVVGTKLLADSFSNAAIEAGILAQQSGASVDYSSRLLAVWRDSGLELGDLLDIMFNLNDRLRESPELADELGVNMEDGKDLAERFVEVVGILQDDIDDVGRKAQLSSQLFGEEGTRQVGRIQLTIDDLAEAIENLPSARVITDQDLEDAKEYEANMREIRGHWDAIKLTAGNLVLPGANDLLSGRTSDALNAIPRAIGYGLGRDAADFLFGNDRTDGAVREPLSPDELDRSIKNLGGTIIINPPGSPTVTVRDGRDYARRNGNVPQ